MELWRKQKTGEKSGRNVPRKVDAGTVFVPVSHQHGLFVCAAKRLRRVEVKELKLMDPSGYAVSALLYRPNSATAENKAPCIITVEGWYNNKEMQDLFSVEYARRGYVVVAVDMHGHGDTTAPRRQICIRLLWAWRPRWKWRAACPM